MHNTKFAPDLITLSDFKVLWSILYFQIHISYVTVILKGSLSPEIHLYISEIKSLY